MAITNCPECEKKISNRSKKCIHCGAKTKRRAGVFEWLIAIVLGFVLVGIIAGGGGEQETTASAETDRAIRATEPHVAGDTDEPEPSAEELAVLTVTDWTCRSSETGTYAQIHGEVRNNIDQNLSSVRVIGSFFTADGARLDSGSAYTEIDPLLPGQTSPFTIWGPRNPEFGRCTLHGISVGGTQVNINVIE